MLAQTFQDYEVLVVDDCSADRSMAIVQEYAAKNKRIKVVQNEANLGLVGNWNRCVELAQGEWIKFVFQDDVITTDCIEKMLAAGLQGFPFVYCARNFLFESNINENTQSVFESHKVIALQAFEGEQKITPEKFIAGILDKPLKNIIGEPTCVLLKKSLFLKYGFFNANLIQKCDIEYWTRIGIQIGAAYIDSELASFRVHSDSTTMQNKKKLRLRFESLIYLQEIVFNPHYQSLRDAAKNKRPNVDFYKDLKSRSQKIYWQIYRENKQEDVAEWNTFVSKYPEIKRLSRLDPTFLLRKLKNKILG